MVNKVGSWIDMADVVVNGTRWLHGTVKFTKDFHLVHTECFPYSLSGMAVDI
jgi:hypothetical protein